MGDISLSFTTEESIFIMNRIGESSPDKAIERFITIVNEETGSIEQVKLYLKLLMQKEGIKNGR